MRERIHVIGERETVLGFALLGIPGSTPRGRDELNEVLRRSYEDPEMALILIEEGLAEEARPTLDELLARRDFPLIVEIPGKEGPLERRSIKEYIAGAIGIRL
ncbi:MAG: V-type ATP synthase subunit F [Candidatus Bipolaricaulia bacterium]